MTYEEYAQAGAWRLYAAHGYAETVGAPAGHIYSPSMRVVVRWATTAQDDAKKNLIAEAARA